ncbi:MAG: hypothetical protein ISN29_00090 [Gammaproteobacteria bacterium AqS3]|nr:hypothetical protein [Gammaproteobacteria bacterium AqS3]
MTTTPRHKKSYHDCEQYADALLEMFDDLAQDNDDLLIYVFESIEYEDDTYTLCYRLRWRVLPTPVKRGVRYQKIGELIDEWEQGFRVGRAHITWNTDRANHGKLTIVFNKEN